MKYILTIEEEDDNGKWQSTNFTEISEEQMKDIMHIALITQDTYEPIDWSKYETSKEQETQNSPTN